MIRGITIAKPVLNIRKAARDNAMKVGAYKPNTQIEILEIVGDWGRSDKGWFLMRSVKTEQPIVENPPRKAKKTPKPVVDKNSSPIVNKTPESVVDKNLSPTANKSTAFVADEPFELYRTLHGTDRPDDYYLGPNYGSFDVASQLLALPRYGNKPAGFVLNTQQINYIKSINGNDAQKWSWLVDQAGTRKVLSEKTDGRIWIPVPICSGGNVVAVVEIKGNFARILTVPADEPIPDNLPDYLCHLWYGITKEGRIFIPRNGVHFPLLTQGSSAWVPLSGLERISTPSPDPKPKPDPNPIPVPVDPKPTPKPDPKPVNYTAPEAFELYITLHGTERPENYYLDVNLGSYDIASSLFSLPKYDPLPAGFVLSNQQVNYIKSINGNIESKWNWLVDKEGTGKILIDRDDGSIYLPNPLCSGGNVVAVVETKGDFARILTFPRKKSIPNNLPNYLLHTWYGVTKNGKIFIPKDGVRFPILAEGSSAWVPLSGLMKVSAPPPKPKPDPIPVDYIAPEAFELYRTLHGTERPENYYLDVNLGSFDIASSLFSLPKYDPLPAGFVLSNQQVNFIKTVNGNIKSKWNWLVDKEGTGKILVGQEDGSIYLPNPLCSSGNMVAVVETKGDFARILTFPRKRSIPNNLPNYLLHTCYGVTKNGKIFIPKNGIRFPILAEGSSAWVPLSGLVKASAPPPVPDPKPKPDPIPVDYTAPEAFELYRTLHGTERPENYYLDVNLGSFDIASSFFDLPKYDSQPAGFVLSNQQVNFIKIVNGNIKSKWNWLVDKEGTGKILIDQDDGSIYLPNPLCSGGNMVAVVETKGDVARILTFPRGKSIPNNLPNYLLHTCYGVTKNGKIFIPKNGIQYPLLAEGSSAWIPLNGLVKV